MSGDLTKAERAEFDSWLKSTAKAKPRDAEFSQAERELHQAWDLVIARVEYTEEELPQLNPDTQRIVRLADRLRVWRQKLPISEEARKSHQEIEARHRRRRQVWHESQRRWREYLFHPEHVPEEHRALVMEFSMLGGEAIAEQISLEKLRNNLDCASSREAMALVISIVYRQQARKRKKRSKSPLSLAVKRLNAPGFDSLLGMLEDADLIDNLFEHLSAPIHIHGIEVDRERLKVTYSIRDRLAPKAVGFKRLKEIFDDG